jgi:hypothetical protein
LSLKTETAPDILLEKASAYAASPRFSEAVLEYTIGHLRFRQAPRFVNKLVSNDVRWRIVGHLLYLDADRETYGAEGGATYGRLLDICTRQQQASRRALTAVLALMRITGFVTTIKSQDGRSKFYKPTKRIKDFQNQWLGYGVRALEILEPDQTRSHLLDDDEATRRFLVSAGREHLDRPLIERMPEIAEVFGTREGSGTVLFAILFADMENQPCPSRAEIAARYGLSKTQVRNNVLAAAEAGYLTLDAKGAARPTQRLVDLIHRWVSLELAFYAAHMQPAQSDDSPPVTL